MSSEPVVLGRINGLFGVRGWVKVFSYTEPREAVLQYKGLLLKRKGQWQPVVLLEGQRHGKSVIAKFEGVADRNQAAELIGAEICVERSALPGLEEGQYYWSDLIGLKVIHRDGSELGNVTSMLETGAHDVMVVTDESEDNREHLIPFVMNEIVIGVDLEKSTISVDWEWD